MVVKEEKGNSLLKNRLKDVIKGKQMEEKKDYINQLKKNIKTKKREYSIIKSINSTNVINRFK